MKSQKALLASLAALLLLTVTADARQENVDPKMPFRDPGNAKIQGRVMLPSGMTSGSNLKIILSNSQSPLMTIYSDKNGEFSFSDLHSGIYYVRVYPDAAQYESLTQQLKLKPSEPAYLVLYLKENNDPVVRERRENTVSVAEADRDIPASAQKAFGLAQKLVEKGDIDGAITELKKAVTIYPGYVIARNNLGVQYLKRRRFEEANEQFEAILEIEPKYFNARLNLGIVLVEQKRFSEATKHLSQAVSLDSSQPAPHLFWGIAALDMNDLEVAERELVKALLLGGPRYSNAHYYFAHVYLKTGLYEKASRELGLFLKTAQPGEMATQARALLDQLETAKK